MRQEVFEFETQQRDGAVVVRLFGELDLAGTELLQGELDRLRRAELSLLTVDLSGLEFMDSTGLRLLLDLSGTCVREQLAITLVPGPRAVQRLFEVTGTEGQFTFTSASASGGTRSP